MSESPDSADPPDRRRAGICAAGAGCGASWRNAQASAPAPRCCCCCCCCTHKRQKQSCGNGFGRSCRTAKPEKVHTHMSPRIATHCRPRDSSMGVHAGSGRYLFHSCRRARAVPAETCPAVRNRAVGGRAPSSSAGSGSGPIPCNTAGCGSGGGFLCIQAGSAPTADPASRTLFFCMSGWQVPVPADGVWRAGDRRQPAATPRNECGPVWTRGAKGVCRCAPKKKAGGLRVTSTSASGSRSYIPACIRPFCSQSRPLISRREPYS